MATKKIQNSKNKRILITAGPTWVPIDSVRVISNIATGETGILLARQAKKLGTEVTLFLGPVSNIALSHLDKAIRIQRFKFFDELKEKIIEELRTKEYDVIIHNAAVSDFKPGRFKGKIDSDGVYDLKLKPLPKIIRHIRHLAPKSKLVMFKLESGVSCATLIRRARQAQKKVRADFVVANTINPYRAFIIDKENNTVSVRSKTELAKRLFKIINLTDTNATP